MDITINQPALKKALKTYQAETGKTHKGIAAVLGMSVGGLRSYLYRKGYSPSFRSLQVIADLLGVSVMELIVEHGRAALLDDDEILVPWFQTRPAAGSGEPVHEAEELKAMAFSKKWLRQFLNITPVKAVLFNIQGDSMSPKLNSGDLVIVDTGADMSRLDGIWLLRIGDVVMVKNIQMISSSQFQAVSDNQIYPPIPLDDNWELIGRVVYRGERL